MKLSVVLFPVGWTLALGVAVLPAIVMYAGLVVDVIVSFRLWNSDFVGLHFE